MVAMICWFVLDGCSYFLVRCTWVWLFPGALWMVTVILGAIWLVAATSWCLLDGRCCFLVRSAWLLLFLGALWMVAGILWCALDGRCDFLVRSGWGLLICGGPQMVAVISWCCYFVVYCGWLLIFCEAPLMVAVPGKILECFWLSVVYWWRPLDTPLREFICIDTLIILRPGGSRKKIKQTIPPVAVPLACGSTKQACCPAVAQ